MNLNGLINSNSNLQVAKRDLSTVRSNQNSARKEFDGELIKQSLANKNQENRDSNSQDFQSKPIRSLNNTDSSNSQIAAKSFNSKSKIEIPENKQVSPEVTVNSFSNKKKTENNAELNLDAVDEKAILMTFLNKMQKEVGVEPQKLIDAFAALSVEELLSPPEESLGNLIKALELPEEKSEKANLLFSQMLGLTAASDLASELASQNQQLNIQVVDKEQTRKAELQKSLANMSNQFFLNNKNFKAPQLGQQKVASAYQQVGGYNLNPLKIEQADNKNGDIATVAMAGAENSNGFNNAALSALGQKAPIGSTQTGIDISSLGPTSSDSTELDIKALLNELKQADDVNQGAVVNDTKMQESGSEEVFNEETENINLMVRQNDELSLEGKKSSLQNETSIAKSKHGSENLITVTQQVDKETAENEKRDSSEQGFEGKKSDIAISAQGQVNDKTRAEFKSFIVNQPQANAAQEAENTKEIINKAQVLIRNGGGEMKVQLNPAGVGEVNLKVMVKNGQVNVEMVADNKQAKELIERGLGDLKSTLAEHKLNLDQIKVNVSSDLGNELSQQQEQMERQFQQRFLHNFQQENQAFKNAFLDLPEARLTKSRENEDQVDNLLEAQNSDRTRRDRKLDLIA